MLERGKREKCCCSLLVRVSPPVLRGTAPTGSGSFAEGGGLYRSSKLWYFTDYGMMRPGRLGACIYVYPYCCVYLTKLRVQQANAQANLYGGAIALY